MTANIAENSTALYSEHPLATKPHSYEPKRSELTFLVLSSSMGVPSGFDLAVFSDKTVIDGRGHIHAIGQPQYNRLLDLASKAGYGKHWRIKHRVSCCPMTRILLPKSTLSQTPAENFRTEFEETSIYGFDKKLRTLEGPVDGLNELPDIIWNLASVASDLAGDWNQKQDEVVLQKVRAILGNVFKYH